MITTNVFSKNILAFNSGVRRIVNMGGTSSSKTFSILQLFLIIAIDRMKEGILISIISESMPHLKQGAIKDFDRILKSENQYNEKNINQTDKIYYFGNSEIQFTPADMTRATGPRRNIVLFNECNNIPYKMVTEYEQRTDETIFYDFNPVAQFWIEDKVINLPSKEYQLIKSNYLDNNQLPDSIRHEIELKASRDPNYKRIHVDVEYGTYEGLIFPEITIIDLFPPGLNNGYGMDFGFTNDPTTLIDVAIDGDNIYFDCALYQTGLFASDIIRFLKSMNIGRKEIIADSSDPRMITEILRAGFNIIGADKGKGSIQHGIDSIKRYKIHVTKRSVEMIKEFRNYSFKKDASDNMLNEPVDMFNHCIDAARYRTSKVLASKMIMSGKPRFTTHS